MAGGTAKGNASVVAPLLEKHIGVFGEGFGPLGVGPTMRRKSLSLDQRRPWSRLIFRRARGAFCKNILRDYSSLSSPQNWSNILSSNSRIELKVIKSVLGSLAHV
jgi:hypothetical protein